jgi:hypothetical protein
MSGSEEEVELGSDKEVSTEKVEDSPKKRVSFGGIPKTSHDSIETFFFLKKR